MKLTDKEKDNILDYLDYYNGGEYNEDVNAVVVPTIEEDSKSFVTSADALFYFLNKGIEAVESGKLTYDQLLGRVPLDVKW